MATSAPEVSAQSLPNRAKVRADGTILLNGDNPYFPFGFQYDYYEPNATGGLTEQNRTNALNALSSAGFDSMHTGEASGAGAGGFNFNTFLANCDAKTPRMNVNVYPGPNTYDVSSSDAALSAYIDTYKGYKSPLWWTLGDDVNGTNLNPNGTINWPPSRIQQRNAVAKGRDPNRLTFISGGGTDVDYPNNGDKNTAPFMGTADCYGVQNYSLSPSNTNPLGGSFDKYAIVTRQADNATYAAGQSKTCVIADLQTFRSAPTDPFPNPALLRGHVYMALAAGVKGLNGYTYERSLGVGKGHEGVFEFPDSWNLLKSLRPEISTLAPVLCDGYIYKDVEDNDGPYARTSLWVFKNKLYVVSGNISPTNPQPVTIPLPGSVAGNLTNLFGARPAGLSFSGGALRGTLPAASWAAGQNVNNISGGVGVYSLDMQPLLANPDFESGYTGWTTWEIIPGSASAVSTPTFDVKSGSKALSHSRNTPYFVASQQALSGLTNGKYTLRAWVRCSGGQEICQMESWNGSNLYSTPITNTYSTELGKHIWTPIVIKDIPVTNGTLTVGVKSKAAANQWLNFDCVDLWRQP